MSKAIRNMRATQNPAVSSVKKGNRWEERRKIWYFFIGEEFVNFVLVLFWASGWKYKRNMMDI